MIGKVKQKFGPILIGTVVIAIVFVFVFYGVFVPGMGGGGGSPGTAGSVNGDSISISEYSRALEQRMEFFRNMMGGKVSEQQLAQFRIREAVFQDLAQRKLLGQIAKDEGFYPSQQEVRDQILKMEVFNKEGRFDKTQYKAVLTQNNYTPSRFEELIGQDIMVQRFQNFLSNLATVTPSEVDLALQSAKDRIKVKYVFLDNEALRKTFPKDAKPETVSAGLDQKIETFSQSVLPALSANQDSKVNAILKATEVKVKTSDWLNSQADFIPGIGSIGSIKAQLMQQKKGAPAQKYSLVTGTLFAKVVSKEEYDASKVTEKERTETAQRLEYQKQSELVQDLTKSWMKKAEVTQNEQVVSPKVN